MQPQRGLGYGKLGIRVPKHRLETILGKSVLIIKRFDRDGGNRIPFLSAMSMLGAHDNEQRIDSSKIQISKYRPSS